MAVQRLINWVGIAKNTGGAKGAGVAAATYGFGVLSGQAFSAAITQDPESQTLNGGTSDRFSPAVNRTEVVTGMNFSTRAWPRMVGLLGYGAMGANVDAGAGPHTHTATPAQTLPYLTGFARGGSEYSKLSDCKVDSLEISWNERDPLELAVEILGLVPTLHTASFTTTNDESTFPYFGPINGTFTLDTGTATPAAAQVKAASIKISNNLQGIPLSKSVLPDDLIEGVQMVEGTITLVPNDYGDWLKVLTGTATGTAVQQTPQYGSFSLKATMDANNELTASALRVAFLCDFPEGDPSGNAMELELAFQCIRPTDGSAAFTLLTKNGGTTDVATY